MPMQKAPDLFYFAPVVKFNIISSPFLSAMIPICLPDAYDKASYSSQKDSRSSKTERGFSEDFPGVWNEFLPS